MEFSEQGSSFAIPSTHNELVGLVRLADYMEVDTFLKAASLWLDVSVDAISNHNPVGKVYKLIRGRYRASRHKGCIDNMTELCIYCFKRIALSPAGMSPCCRRKCTSTANQESPIAVSAINFTQCYPAWFVNYQLTMEPIILQLSMKQLSYIEHHAVRRTVTLVVRVQLSIDVLSVCAHFSTGRSIQRWRWQVTSLHVGE